MRLKSTICESTLSTAARSPFPNGEGCETRIPLSSHCQYKYTYMWKNNIDGQSLPRVGKVASGASRIGQERYEKERRRSSQVRRLREHPIHRCAVPLPQRGRLRYESIAFLALSERIHAYMEKQYRRTKPSPRGEGAPKGRIGY